MAGSLIVPKVAPSAAATPPDSSHFSFFVADGTEGSTADAYYKKSSAGVSTALVPPAYTDENAQDAAAALFADSTEFDYTYNDAGNVIGVILFANSITYAKLQQVSASQRLLGRTSAGAGTIEELTVAQLDTMRSWALATRSFTGSGTALTNATTEQIINGSVFTIPANTLQVGDVIHHHVGLVLVQALIATATNTIIRQHFGPLGTVADPIIASCAVNLNGTVAGNGRPLIIDANATIKTSTQAIGDVDGHGSAIIAPVAATTGLGVIGPIAVSLTVPNILTMTIQQPTANITGGYATVAYVERAV